MHTKLVRLAKQHFHIFLQFRCTSIAHSDFSRATRDPPPDYAHQGTDDDDGPTDERQCKDEDQRRAELLVVGRGFAAGCFRKTWKPLLRCPYNPSSGADGPVTLAISQMDLSLTSAQNKLRQPQTLIDRVTLTPIMTLTRLVL